MSPHLPNRREVSIKPATPADIHSPSSYALLKQRQPANQPLGERIKNECFLQRDLGRFGDALSCIPNFGRRHARRCRRQLLIARCSQVVSRHGELHHAQCLRRIEFSSVKVAGVFIEKDCEVDVSPSTTGFVLQHRLVGCSRLATYSARFAPSFREACWYNLPIHAYPFAFRLLLAVESINCRYQKVRIRDRSVPAKDFCSQKKRTTQFRFHR
jgi:hypothetical protein